jgi:hypothetical protein
MGLPRFDAVRLASTDRIPGSNGRTLPAALIVGAGAFAFRILSLRGLPNDHYMPPAWAQQILFSDVSASLGDQELMIERLTTHRVPVVLIIERSREQSAAAYPRLYEYLRSAYAPAGRFDHYDGSEITVAVHRNLKATSAFAPEGWPCGFNEAG